MIAHRDLEGQEEKHVVEITSGSSGDCGPESVSQSHQSTGAERMWDDGGDEGQGSTAAQEERRREQSWTAGVRALGLARATSVCVESSRQGRVARFSTQSHERTYPREL
jgi:hypothetical protein